MNRLLYAAFALNLALCICEIYILGNIKRKTDILKYYTFLQNFLSLIASFLFCVCLIAAILFDCAVPEFAKGLRYVTTCGLTAAAFIYVVFLSSNDQNHLKENDFIRLSPAKANFLLHCFCPLISLLSLVVFERQMPLSASVWTLLAALPSCIYWILYSILSAAKLWAEPYVFSADKGRKSTLTEALIITLIPLSFILISFVLWKII